METRITQVSPVEYELEIRAARDVLEPKIDKALKAQRQHVTLKGFRPGHVPLSIVRRLHGRAISYEVVDNLIQETYREEVLEGSGHEVMGSPTITKLEYEPEGDLSASIQFGVRPTFEIKDMSVESLTRLKHMVTEEEVDEEIDRLRASRATFTPREGPAQDGDFVRADLQRLDDATDAPLIGERQEGVRFFLGGELDPNVKQALLATTSGSTVRLSLQVSDSEERNRFAATVTDVQTRSLPELTDEFASSVTENEITTVDELRSSLRNRLQQRWNQLLRDRLESEAMKKLIEAHEFEVPHGVVHIWLDSMIDDVKRNNGGSLPDGFDAHDFHHEHHAEAEEMARWMLIRDKIVTENGLTVNDDELDDAFSDTGRRNEQSGQSVRKMFEKHYPDMIDQMSRRIENRKVFDWIFDQFMVEEVEWTDDREG